MSEHLQWIADPMQNHPTTMLRITESESPQAAKHYYGRSLSRGDYYFQGQEIVGKWNGRAARSLGLDGHVEYATFTQLMDNLRPDGHRLTARTNANRRPGYDFTFDVPKSISLVHALAHDERIVEAMHRAVDDTMGVIEKDMFTRVRVGGAFEDRRTGNMVWADFTHFTSRPAPVADESVLLAANLWAGKLRGRDGVLAVPDPHLHVHVYAINATFDPDERKWKAGEFMRIKRDAGYYQAVYHAKLAECLQRLGYEIDGHGRAFELRGVSRETIDAYSRRTKEVEDTARELGITDAHQKDGLGAKTRRGKNNNLSTSQLEELWRSMSAPDVLKALEGVFRAAKGMERSRSMDSKEVAAESIEYALRHELERASVVAERRLLATALERAVGRASVESVRAALAGRADILRAEIGGEVRVSTAEILKEESALLRYIREGLGSVAELVAGRYVFTNPLFAKDAKDTAEQRAAVLHVLQSNDWVVGVVGRAGTGKTTLLKEISAGVAGAGKRLILCAPTAEAARGVLRGEGFAQAETVKKLLTDADMQAGLRGNVLWIDEAGMLGNRDMLELLTLAKANGARKVVLAGDPKQIRSVARGDAFRFLEENAGLKVARLEKIHRQKTPELKAAVDAMSRGDISRGMKLLDEQKSIVAKEAKAAHKALAETYVEKLGDGKKPRTVLVVCPTHREGEALTKVIREELREAGRIDKNERSIPRTINLSWTDAEKRNPALYETGLVVQFKQNAQGFAKSERARVSSIDAREGRVMVVKNDRSQVALPLDKAAKFQVYRLAQLEVARGDRLRVTENGFDKNRTHRLNNGETIEVAGFTPSGDIVAKGGKVVPRQFGHLDHGYVVTADAAQSKTVDVVLAAVGRDSLAATDMRRMYVTISRAREEVKLFTDDRDGLMRAAQRDSERHFATDINRYRIAQQIALEDYERQRELEREQEQIRTIERAREHDGPEMEMEI
jgi:hypothetical protein